MPAFLILLSLLFVWALVSDRLARWSVTAPIAFAVAGIVLTRGPHPAVPVDLETHGFEIGVELVLAVLLFVDATETRDYEHLNGPGVAIRLLGLALPASVVLAVLAGALLFPGTEWWLLVVTALVVMPMDLAPASTFVRDRRVPVRVRAALNIEGGFNDGIISPVFVFCVANLVAVRGSTFTDLAFEAVRGAGLAVVAGTVLGLPVSWLVRRALATGWARTGSLRLASLALPFMAYAASNLMGGNGFVAAFVAGLWYAAVARDIGDDDLGLVRDVAQLMALALWFTFGKMTADEFADGIALAVVVYALFALTAARFVPVVLSLTGTGFDRAERTLIGFFGPRGVTSIVFGVLAVTQLPDEDSDFVVNVMCAAVLFSVVLHGAAAEPIACRFARRTAPPADPP
ncbi:cation:proton antiporter [Spirillospora sp. CA-253888]